MSQQAAGAGRSVMVDGRIVWSSGDLFKGRQKTDQNTKQPRRNAAGELMMEYGFGLAVLKSALQQTGPGQPGEIWGAMYAEALTMYPNGQVPPSFAMKYKDGDTIDDKGQPFNLREGYAGHLVFACTTSLPIKWFRWENGGNVLVNDGIKCGDYVRVNLQIKAHAAHGQGKAGLYLNPNMVQLLGAGKEIINTPSGDAVFGNAAPAMPQGAIPFNPGPMPGAPAQYQPPQQFAPPQAAQPHYQPPAQPSYQPPVAAAPPQPHYGVVPPAHQPPPGGMPAPMPAPQQQWAPQPPVQQQQYPPQPGFPPVPQ